MGRAPCCDKANVKKGPWSPEEDAKLKAYIEKHGTGGNWIALPQKIGLKRCGKSCRLRWLNYLRPNIKHGGFSEEEDNIICSLYVSIGSRWSVIAAQLPGRTDNDIKNYWNTRLKKKLLGKQRKDQQLRNRGKQEGANRGSTSNPLLPPEITAAATATPQYPYWPRMPVISPMPYSNHQDLCFNDQDSIKKLLIKLGGRFSDEADDYRPTLGALNNIPDQFPDGTPSTQPICEEQVNRASSSCMINNGMILNNNQVELAQETGGLEEIVCSSTGTCNTYYPQRLDGLEWLYGEDMTMVYDKIGQPTYWDDTASLICPHLVASSYQGMPQHTPQQCAFQELSYHRP